MSKVKVTGNKNVKIVFRAYLRQNGSICVKLKPKLPPAKLPPAPAHFTHIFE